MVQYKTPGEPSWQDEQPLWNTQQPNPFGQDPHSVFNEDPNDTFAFLKRQKNKKRKPKATQPDETTKSTDATPPKGNPEEDAETLFGLPLESLKSRVGSADSQKERAADTLAEAATTPPPPEVSSKPDSSQTGKPPSACDGCRGRHSWIAQTRWDGSAQREESAI
jgi:hypothetical protein